MGGVNFKKYGLVRAYLTIFILFVTSISLFSEYKVVKISHDVKVFKSMSKISFKTGDSLTGTEVVHIPLGEILIVADAKGKKHVIKGEYQGAVKSFISSSVFFTPKAISSINKLLKKDYKILKTSTAHAGVRGDDTEEKRSEKVEWEGDVNQPEGNKKTDKVVEEIIQHYDATEYPAVLPKAETWLKDNAGAKEAALVSSILVMSYYSSAKLEKALAAATLHVTKYQQNREACALVGIQAAAYLNKNYKVLMKHVKSKEGKKILKGMKK